jgi:uroporphyrinogen III methyltransferase/synthase
MTVRGMQCLSSADVVLYDHLVPARVLRYARGDAEKIDVGTAAPQPLEQEAICYLLAEKAREGKTVARLKWGDPFVFDRGGSEALFLHEQGVRFEVVPGVPAGVAVPSYAGVPITYPGGGDTLTFVRGHEDDGKIRASVDWASLARLDGTIVCYTGPQELPHILSCPTCCTRSCRTADRRTIRPRSSTTARCRRSRRSAARSAASRRPSSRLRIVVPRFSSSAE